MRGRFAFREVSWGPSVVALLVPQRRPFVLLDRVMGVVDAPVPALRGARHISANEPVFDGHFPQVDVWPGALTLEGVAQAAGALASVVALSETMEDLGAELDHVELGATLGRGWDAEREAAFRARLAGQRRPLALAGGARLKFASPVFPGCRLDYEVWLERRMGELVSFGFEASVDGRLVVEGSLSASSDLR
ncbi:MAG: hypothetical protein H6738_25745 [Alphaproteobacteria bacterium]|nr:hypothetical protein [Alphaproteobacteria bacterium]